MERVAIQTSKNVYYLKFGINAHCEAEELLGFPLSKLSEENTGVSTLRTLTYVGLKYAGQQVTLTQAGDIMEEIVSDHGFEHLVKKITEAINKSIQTQNNRNFVNKRNQKKS